VGVAAGAAFLACFLAAAEVGQLFETVRVGEGRQLNLIAGLPRLGEFVAKTLPVLRWETLGADLAAWLRPWRIWGRLLWETLLIAWMATLLAGAAALALSFPAARNLAPRRWMQWTTRRGLELARTVPDLVWALIFVYCFGAGPMAGVLAIAVHGAGALGKLFAEANENADMRQVVAVRAAGGDWFQQMRYGALPQVLPAFLSYALLRFEINVRSSSIIGFVGAGGLGQEIRTAISLQAYTDLSALFLIILATVIVIDLGCERLRHGLIGLPGAR
jgi:phosphonate transport system permease protein